MTDMTIEEELSTTCEQRDALDIECARLEKEVDALRKDAKRYRWLRDKCNHVHVGVHIQFSSNERDADAAIDAAMKGANA